jgi:hypothetical protein
MTSIEPNHTAERNPVDVLAEAFVERQRRGEHPSLGEYTTGYPDLAEEIRLLVPALLMMERLRRRTARRPWHGRS